MRAFNESQLNVFLNAFGQSIETSTGITFTGIVEVIPVSIDTGGGGFIEGEETYVSAKKADIVTAGVTINSVLIIEGENFVVYNIVDDLSGMVNVYYRTEQGQSFAENY
ncbi:hypothetical protein EDF81_0075 [Enterobacter sp. BIGb0383]|uniref:hypothetical protein n=1 Tax=unclassified Enterobacter TaxID=2608935 RepID=UPI000F4A9E56|nr:MULTISPECIES: hypothetical protein [unclassified Enterobacter]ROP61604.1 hypothetical protein EDF81_0075 [Enterobacter sp. BIGb0383]ROS11765.1 hypothetical protein EC848_0075 [Enterobacter sp. BIGb0359]